jgi:hypothetical protein
MKAQAPAPGGFAMTNRLTVATVAYALLLLQIGSADAGGPYDGEWKGTATSTGAGCKRGAAVNLTVEGQVVLGQAKFDGDASSINGAVDAKGSVGATIGFQFLTGRFSGEEFEGTFKFSDCQWEANLKRTNAGSRAATSGLNNR